MNQLGGILLCGAAMVVVCGCANVQKPETAAVPAAAPTMTASEAQKLETRNNAVSLLYDLTQEEKNVGKILIIKSGSKEFDGLIKAIAQTTGDSGVRLEQLAADDPQMKLHALELPAGEKATRAAIAKTKEHELLFSSGDNFQFNMLLTQVDALSYGWHLAKIAGDNSQRPEEVRAFVEISAALANLYQQDVEMLKAEAKKSR